MGEELELNGDWGKGWGRGMGGELERDGDGGDAGGEVRNGGEGMGQEGEEGGVERWGVRKCDGKNGRVRGRGCGR